VANKKTHHITFQALHYYRLTTVFVSEINRNNKEQNIDKRNWGEKGTRSSEPLNIKRLQTAYYEEELLDILKEMNGDIYKKRTTILSNAPTVKKIK
jgi:hypothetical protein